jgi:dTDP-glucose 4,6-dehydratase
MISKASKDEKLPVYGNGLNVRDWIHVYDHNVGVDMIVRNGKPGETYNLGGHAEKANIEIVKIILKELGKPESLITYVKDRPGHDLRYAMDPTKLETELGWKPKYTFDTGIEPTIKWNLENQTWLKNVESGEYLNWLKKHYN